MVETMKIEPRGDRVFCRDVPVGERRTGYLARGAGAGLIVAPADKADDDRDVRECIVVAVGPGWRFDSGRVVPCGVEPGDRILVSLNATKHEHAEIDGERLRIVRFWDLLGVVEGGP